MIPRADAFHCMLAFLYLILIFFLGDSICKRFFPFVSTPHRVATGFLAGLLMSTWLTYLASALFGETSYPMLAGNLLFAVLAIGTIIALKKFPAKDEPKTTIDEDSTRFKRADWIVTGIFVVVSMVMMFGTFSMREGNMRIAHHQSSDFGSTASIMQSFALGHNFPTEYPHFTGDRIRYHFLFYFQAGNLEYLGLSPASSNNVLSILTLLSMLILVMTLGSVLFASRMAGRIGAILFFFHGSLAFIPFYIASGSLTAMWNKIWPLRDFLSSGLPYRGEDWGVWSQVVYLNQRHLASSIGLFLIVVIFLAIRQRERAGVKASEAENAATVSSDERAQLLARLKHDSTDLTGQTESEIQPAKADDTEQLVDTSVAEKSQDMDQIGFDVAEPDSTDDTNEDDKSTGSQDTSTDDEADNVEKGDSSKPISSSESEPEKPTDNNSDITVTTVEWIERLKPFVFAGLLLGLMPMWNGAVFAGAAAVLALMFLILPLRREMIAIAVASAIVSLPQVLFLKTGLAQPAAYSTWYFGYTVTEPTIYKVLYYLAFTFGFKWILIGIAIALGNRLQRLMILGFTALILMATCFQFSEEILANHKFFNIWLVLMNVPVAFGLIKLWKLIPGPAVIASRVLTIVFLFFIVIGGLIDLFPIKNSFWVEYRFQGDPLVEWVRANTDPRSIFLSHRYVNHGILVAGRRLFYGHPYYAWGAGYPTAERDGVYRTMFESKDINEIFRLLKENRIGYVAIDNIVRKGDFIKNNNEKIYQAYFPLVFDDTENKYDGIKIFAVPETLGAPNPTVQLDPTPTPSPATVSNAFNGGEGNGSGQFSRPRGIASDSKGSFYVADTGNARVQKFDADGKFIASFGKPGSSEGEMREPNGVAVDDTGNIYVTDASNHKLLKLDSTGTVLKEWKGPDPGFYGPRDIEFGPDKKLYIVDQGRTRVVVFDPTSEAFTSWGTSGTGESQFNDPTGIAIGGGFIFVTDTGNMRVQVFDMTSKFVRQWTVDPWEKYIWHFPDVIYDEVSKNVWVSNGWKKEIVVYDTNGNLIGEGFKPGIGIEFNNPSGLSFLVANKKRSLLVLNTGGHKVSTVGLEPVPQKSPQK